MNSETTEQPRDDGLEWLREIRRQMAAEAGNDPRVMGEKLRELEKRFEHRMLKSTKVLVPASNG